MAAACWNERDQLITLEDGQSVSKAEPTSEQQRMRDKCKSIGTCRKEESM